MSRGVRDLRELICVSRLTFCESDEERDFSEPENGLSGDFDKLSIASSDSSGTTVGDSTSLHSGQTSPDSGCVTNGSTPPDLPLQDNDISSLTPVPDEGLQIAAVPLPPSSKATERIGKVRRKKKREHRKILDTVPSRHDLPKPTKLPPLSSKLMLGLNSSEFDVDMESFPEQEFSKNATLSRTTSGNFDDMMAFMDATVVSNWLERANKMVNELTHYCNCGENFVHFAHFWLADFQDFQKVEIFELEHSILSEELGFAFSVGKDQGKVTHRDIFNLIKALFKEYPGKLLSAKGPHLFLDYLDILSSQKHEQYKKLLSDVKCSTRNKQHAQWMLATRSFALVSVWSAIVNFYRNLLASQVHSSILNSSSACAKETNHMRFSQAIRHGYVDVVHYFIVGEHVDPNYIDKNGRTYVFTAVMHSQSEVLKYLLKRVKPSIDINKPADTGNSPLHAAANVGYIKCVEALLSSPQININATNSQCENATPLHLAVMHDHRDVVQLLVSAGADVALKMGDLSPQDIARQFGNVASLIFL